MEMARLADRGACASMCKELWISKRHLLPIGAGKICMCLCVCGGGQGGGGASLNLKTKVKKINKYIKIYYFLLFFYRNL